MAIDNPWKITYGDRTVGGISDTYLLHGPYVIDKSFTNMRLVFDVIVVAVSHGDLKNKSGDLEDDFRKRDQDLTINLSDGSFSYVSGTDFLNPTASLSKAGDRDTDRGYSRAYTLVIEAELPADDNDGLRDYEANVDYEAGRQKVVTFRGVYTALNSTLAVAQYQSDFDGEASTVLSAIDSGAAWELADENYTRDRNDHTCTFLRQYVELLANQSQGSRDDTSIRDHRVVFTDLSQHPGDSKESVYRLRRVIGNYDGAIDIDVETGMDLQSIVRDKVKPHVLELFRSEFNPQVLCIEDSRESYDETSKRISVAYQFLYQTDGGDDVVEVSQTLAYREARSPDRTPVHDGNELTAYIDPGWATVERIATRTVIVLGNEEPKRRLGQTPEVGPAGEIEGIEGLPELQQSGWNIVANTSQVMHEWLGDPSEEQIEISILTETVVESFNEAPGAAQGNPFRGV